MLVPTKLAPRLYENLNPTIYRLAPRDGDSGSNRTIRFVFFSLVAIIALAIIGLGIRRRVQFARRHPMGVVPPGPTLWSRLDARSPTRRSYLERHRSSFDPASHDRHGQLPVHPDNAHLRNPRMSPLVYPLEPALFASRTFCFPDRPSSPAPSYEEPKPFSPVVVQALKQDNGKSEKDPLSENVHDCPICFEEFTDDRPAVIGAPCGHVLCKRCWNLIVQASKEAAHARRFGGPGDIEVARCHACRTPYVRKTKPTEVSRK